MLRKIGYFFAFILLVSSLSAEDFDNIELLKNAGLTEEVIGKIRDVNMNYQKEIQEAKIELNIYKAQLEKLLFFRAVNLENVEKLLRDSMEWKLKMEMARIKRRVVIRLLMDEEKWSRLVQHIQKYLRATDRAEKDEDED